MKNCTQCGQEKNLNYFYKDSRTKDGRYSACKDCHRTRYLLVFTQEVRENPTPKIVAQHKMSAIAHRLSFSRHYTNIKCLFSLEELEEFFKEHWDLYMELHKKWVEADYTHGRRPTIDRINPKLHYSLDNIQLIDLGENTAKDKRGKPITEEHRNKISVSKRGIKQTEAHIKNKSEAVKRYYAKLRATAMHPTSKQDKNKPTLK